VPKEWVKLVLPALQSETLQALHDDHPRAEGVFFRLLLASDDFGRILADPRYVASRIRPFSNKQPRSLAGELAVLEQAGMLFYYEAEGKTYLQITNYETYQDRESWTQMRAECPAPPGYEPPESLLKFLTEANDRRYSRQRYGLPETDSDSVAQNPTGRNLSEPVGLCRTQSPTAEERRVKEGEKRGEGEERGDARAGARPLAGNGEGRSDRDRAAYLRPECGPLLESLRSACPAIHGSKSKLDRWLVACHDAARDQNYPLDLEQIAAALLTDPPAGTTYPDAWLEKQRKAREPKRGSAPAPQAVKAGYEEGWG
jgi:hypothetical protein